MLGEFWPGRFDPVSRIHSDAGGARDLDRENQRNPDSEDVDLSVIEVVKLTDAPLDISRRRSLFLIEKTWRPSEIKQVK